MTEINASIITIGDELLIGQTIDTNSAFIAQELNKIGVWVKRRVAIADTKEAILTTLADEAKVADIIIITGGLGPTADDITKPALCEYFETDFRKDEGAVQNVRTIFEKLGRPITERNLAQGMVPANCIVLPNARGTAPGMWFETNGSQKTAKENLLNGSPSDRKVVYASLPGVPHEMKGLILGGVLPKIKESFVLPAMVHRTLLTAGQGESFIADALMDFESQLPSSIKLAYLPAYGMVRLRLTGKAMDKAAIEKQVDQQFQQLKRLVKEWLVA